MGHEMEETLGVGVEQIQAPDSAMVGVELDQHLQEKIQICELNSEVTPLNLSAVRLYSTNREA